MDTSLDRKRGRSNRRSSRRKETGGSQSSGAWEVAWGTPKGGADKPFKNRLNPYDILSSDELETVHLASIRILQEMGICVRGDPYALELWKSAGADVQGNMVRVPQELIERLLSLAPGEFTQHARNPARSVTFGADNVVFSPIFASPFVRDLDNKRRQATLADFHDLLKLTHMSACLNYGGAQICEPMDIAAPKRHLEMVRGHLTFSEKPFLGDARADWRARDSFEMCEIVFGKNFARQNVVLLGLVTASSPRLWDEDMLKTLRYYAEMGQSLLITPFIMQGANTPVTIAGALAQANAEAMFGMAYAQLIRPGTPVIYGCSLATVSMKSGAPLYGTSEIARLTLAMGQLARRYKVPYRIGGSRNGGMESDSSTGAQNAMTMMPALLSRANFILHSVGWLENSMSVSFAQFILDLDQLALLQEFVKGIDVDDETLALQAISMAQPAGDYFANPHTVKHYRSTFIEPMMPTWGTFDAYESAGSPSLVSSALDWAKRALNAYEQPPLDIAVKEELDAFVARRMAELPDIET